MSASLFDKAIKTISTQVAEKDNETFVTVNVRPDPKDVALIEVWNEINAKSQSGSTTGTTYSVDFANDISDHLAKMLCNSRYLNVLADFLVNNKNKETTGAIQTLYDYGVLEKNFDNKFEIKFFIGEKQGQFSEDNALIQCENLSLVFDSLGIKESWYSLTNKVYKICNGVEFTVSSSVKVLTNDEAINWATENCPKDSFAIVDGKLLPVSEEYSQYIEKHEKHGNSK